MGDAAFLPIYPIMPHIFSSYRLSDVGMISNSKSTRVLTGKDTGLSPGGGGEKIKFDGDSGRFGATWGTTASNEECRMKKSRRRFSDLNAVRLGNVFLKMGSLFRMVLY
jgi:hypothetical protein